MPLPRNSFKIRIALRYHPKVRPRESGDTITQFPNLLQIKMTIGKKSNFQTYHRMCVIQDTPNGVDTSKIRWVIKEGEEERIAKLMYLHGDKELSMYINIRNPSVTFNDTGTRMFVQLTDRQLEEWNEFFQALQDICKEQTGWDFDTFLKPVEDVLSIKIINPESWTPSARPDSIQVGMFGWKFTPSDDTCNAGISLSIFPPKTRNIASVRKRARVSADERVSEFFPTEPTEEEK